MVSLVVVRSRVRVSRSGAAPSEAVARADPEATGIVASSPAATNRPSVRPLVIARKAIRRVSLGGIFVAWRLEEIGHDR